MKPKNAIARVFRFALVAFLAAVILAARASAGTASIGWNTVPAATKYRLWRGIELLATVTEPAARVALPEDQISDLTVTAIVGERESEHSQSLRLQPVLVQESTDLGAWKRLGVLYTERPLIAFYRLTPPLSAQ